MAGGLNLWQNNNRNVLLDADNLFWAITKEASKNKKDGEFFVPRQVLRLYEKVKDKLDSEFYDFRFSQGLSAIYIDPTDKCNASCPYCYIPAKIRQNGRSMTSRELGFILNKIKQYFSGTGSRQRKPVIIFHASEPLLVKEILFEAISHYSRYFKFGLQTNGVLLQKSDVEFLKRKKVGVGISLDSSLASINNRLRASVSGGGNFAKAVKAIEWFDGYEGLNIIATVTKVNVKGLSELVKFLHAKRAPCVLCNPVRLTQKNSRALKPEAEALTKYFIDAVNTAIQLSTNSRHKIIIGNFSNVILAIVSPLARRLMCDISPCGGARCFFTITASGEMIPCGEFIGLKGFSGGNIFKDSISKAMNSEPFKRIRARIVENIGECGICLFRNICGAPCPAELYALGDMHQESVFCKFYKEIIKYAFRIISEGKEKICLRTEGLEGLRYQYCID